MADKKMAIISGGVITNTAVWDGVSEWDPGADTGEITSRRLKIGQAYVPMSEDSSAYNIVIDGSSIAASTAPRCIESAMAELGVIPDCIYNVAVGGRTITALMATAPSLVDAKYSSVHGWKNICMLWEVINEINLGLSSEQVFANLTVYCQARKAAGFKTIVNTCLPWSLSGETKEQRRLEVNTMIKNAVGNGVIDAVADIASDAIMGDPANCSDTTYFLDGTHPTAAGLALLKTYWKTALASLVE